MYVNIAQAKNQNNNANNERKKQAAGVIKFLYSYATLYALNRTTSDGKREVLGS